MGHHDNQPQGAVTTKIPATFEDFRKFYKDRIMQYRPITMITDEDLMSEEEKNNKKLLALADMLVQVANGNSARQSMTEINMAQEYAPLAEYVIKQLGAPKGA